MAEHLLGERLAERHEHDRPDDGMKAHDLLAHDVHVRRPVFAVERIIPAAPPERGNVV
ncbi:hypothetical protein SDC9_172013 [bioreactor metagenome]|uniref:Uncharacterized protein n=1 Tax=bioreactor metagenome TaxID=1076179 RepID=A0A645GF12_9ZZZZ